MKLLYASPSPYSSKVRMAARHADIAMEEEAVATADEPSVLLDANPLGKIPTLILGDGSAVFDSRAIMQELNRTRRNALFPTAAAKRREAERLEALGDGMCDAMLAIVYDRRTRPKEKQHEPFQEGQWRKVVRALDALEVATPRVTTRLHGGHFALAAALGYADLRHPERDWRRGRPKLRRFLDRFAERFEAWDELKPR